jgi:hypothetical protein
MDGLMPGIPVYSKTGPRTFTPANDSVQIVGGLLVEARSGGRVGVAAAASVHVLGVALTDAQAPEALVTTPTVEAQLTYSANASFGDLLVATANGTVAPATTGTGGLMNPLTIVGRCTEPLGVTVLTSPLGLSRLA